MSALPQPQDVLAAHAVGASLGGRPVLHGIDLAFGPGRWVSIVGPNGAGKSTLLRVLAGLLPHTGRVTLCGRELGSLPARERARAISWLGQNEAGADDLTVHDVVLLGRLPHRAWLAPASAADHEAVREALCSVDAWAWRDRPLGQLSGGERQRVLLARALAVQAGVLLMDEPLANLDPPHQADWLRLVRELAARGCTVLSVMHEISLALQADELVVMDRGGVLHHGPCSEAASHRALEAVFAQRIAVRELDGHWMALPRI